MKKTITIVDWNGERRVSLGAYARAWRRVRLDVESGHGDRTYRRGFGVTGTCTAEEALREFRRGLHDRINRKVPGHGVGRWWNEDVQWELRRLADRINSRAVVREHETSVFGRMRGRIPHGRYTDEHARPVVLYHTFSAKS